MKWILYVMLFTTPAANVTNKADRDCLAYEDVGQILKIIDCRPRFEGRHVWSLQSSSQLEFSSLETCVKTQDVLIANSNVASTMTLRTWCFCDSDNKQCPTRAENKKLADAIRLCEVNPDGDSCKKAPKTRFDLVPPNAAAPEGQNSSSIRLYPP
ncbi:hypothetical protein [Bradyrhizobium sp. ERR14]|uniref:hypothetical protein n=1 Tax=Bradyrhizobium sp. ERR14 TaxID=2663837 RepID=UPI0016101F5E|nr:hypothetical protein [Bradyrhizobium sp. ERR14]MBB4395093.1 hypothetical protein [Bradyrhizobium sp. ERR14]